MSEIRVFSAEEVAALLPVTECIDVVDAAFRDGGDIRTFVGGVGTPDGAGKFHLKAALGSGARPVFAAKINANFPDNPRLRSLPTIQGVLALFDATDGRVLALMDSMSITIIRTAAATGVAAKYLARPDAKVAAIIGCGAQALAQLDAVLAVRPIRRVRAFDMSRDSADAFAATAQGRNLEVTVTDDLPSATRYADVVVTSTPSREPFLNTQHLHPGTFIAAVGTDNPEKQELFPELIASSLLVVDDPEQCATMGDLHHAIEAGVVDRSHVAGTLADVVRAPDRFTWKPDRTVVFDSTGIPLEDVVAAALVYERAERSGGGQTIRLA